MECGPIALTEGFVCKPLVSTIAALAMPIFEPVPYVEITKRLTSHFPLELVHTVHPGHGRCEPQLFAPPEWYS